MEQDQADEPASELLKRIETEKAQLTKAGSIRPSKPLEPIEENETLFAIPHSWKWIRLAGVGSVVGGGTPPSADPACFTAGGKGIAWLTPADLGKHSGLYILHGARDLTEKGFSSSSAQLMPAGSVLFTSRAPIGYTAIAANEITTNQGFKSVIPFILESNRYIATYFKAFATWIDGKASGTTFKEVSGKIVANLPFPLPPLAEQHRIVAKVDQLMAICDELEAAQAKRERRRDRLVAATLHGLNNGNDSSEPGGHPTFEESARFYFNHLPRLTTRPEHIQQLRQAILNLTVRGKLVWQDTKQQALTVESLEVPFYLPASWRWKTIGDLGKTQTGSTPPTVERQHYDGNIPFIKPAAISDGVINYEGQCLTESGVRESTLVHAGAILMVCIGGSIGKAALVTRPVCFNQQINSVSPTEGIDAHYLLFAMQSPYFRACVVNAAAQGTLPIISKGKWERLLIPVPPLAEQHQIVAKVDELMALCDELETHLTNTTATRRQLLEATLQEALIGGM